MKPEIKTIRKVVIVIPVHSPNPSAYELVSFQQCFTVLGNHPIKILAPKGLELAAYRAVVPIFDTVFIDPKWQNSLWQYNKLKTSRFFYRLFSEYQFLLTYELDAFVFRDDLLSWCAREYDYIGAPWFEGFGEQQEHSRLTGGVGNSGFSLRRVEPIEKLLKDIYYKNRLEYEGRPSTRLKAHLKAPFRRLFHAVSNRLGENYTIQHHFPFFEDIFFGLVAPTYERRFRVAPVAEAMKFSFEVNPAALFELTNHTLPMGCHAWWRYAPDFWKPHIEAFGYTL